MPPAERPRCEVLFWACSEPSLAGFGVPGGYTPTLLGPTAQAAGEAIGARMEAMANRSRAVASRPEGFVATHLLDDNWWLGNASAATLALMAEMGQGSTRLVADSLFTAWVLGTQPPQRRRNGTRPAPAPSQRQRQLSPAEWGANVAEAARLDRLATR